MIRKFLVIVFLALMGGAALAQTAPTAAPAGMSQDQFDALVDAISNSVTEKLKAEGAASPAAPAAAPAAAAKPAASSKGAKAPPAPSAIRFT